MARLCQLFRYFFGGGDDFIFILNMPVLHKDFAVTDNPLTTLEGFPRKIGDIAGFFNCGFDENSTAPEYLSSVKIEGIDNKLLEKMIQNWKKIHGQSGALCVAANQINTKAQNETNPHLNEDASHLIAKIKYGKGK